MTNTYCISSALGVIVLLTTPDPDTVGGDIVGAEQFDYDIYPPDALKTDNPTSVGASWVKSEDKSINEYGRFKFSLAVRNQKFVHNQQVCSLIERRFGKQSHIELSASVVPDQRVLLHCMI